VTRVATRGSARSDTSHLSGQRGPRAWLHDGPPRVAASPRARPTARRTPHGPHTRTALAQPRRRMINEMPHAHILYSLTRGPRRSVRRRIEEQLTRGSRHPERQYESSQGYCCRFKELIRRGSRRVCGAAFTQRRNHTRPCPCSLLTEKAPTCHASPRVHTRPQCETIIGRPPCSGDIAEVARLERARDVILVELGERLVLLCRAAHAAA
jgi:hypothetical protein